MPKKRCHEFTAKKFPQKTNKTAQDSRRVFKFKGLYKGQIPIKLVMSNNKAIISNIKAAIPEITFIRYKIAIVNAHTNLIDLSIVPIFFFIIFSPFH